MDEIKKADNQNKKRKGILWGIVAVLVLALLVACTIVPKRQAKKA